MFFPERLVSIAAKDHVLEVGPGGTPHPRSDIFLEKEFSNEDLAKRQRGNTESLKTSKPVIYYDGTAFPFKDNEFDYVICSQVLEHVPDVEFFLTELQRVAPRGYLEFPTIYYDYIYNFKDHINILMKKDDIIYFATKKELGMNALAPVTHFLYDSFAAGCHGFVQEAKLGMFQGFEWERTRIKASHSKDINDFIFSKDTTPEVCPIPYRFKDMLKVALKRRIKRILKRQA